MTSKAGQGVVRAHAFPVIRNSNQLPAAFLNIYGNPRCPCIERIFQQLFHDGSRSLDDLASRNSISYIIG
jgi:hypothetical protein